jgi:preprotein translocase subunit SecD
VAEPVTSRARTIVALPGVQDVARAKQILRRTRDARDPHGRPEAMARARLGALAVRAQARRHGDAGPLKREVIVCGNQLNGARPRSTRTSSRRRRSARQASNRAMRDRATTSAS